MSGVAITSQTRFLNTNQQQTLQTVAYYLDYAMAVYGWPMYAMLNKGTGCCRLCPFLTCSQNSCCFKQSCCFRNNHEQNEEHEQDNEQDNCCSCNRAAMQRILSNKTCEIIYSTYHVEIGEPPFLVALDHTQKAIVISIRGTLSLQDIITDLNAEGDLIPTEPAQDRWLAHKGMIEAAVYIRQQLSDRRLIERALAHGSSTSNQTRLRTQSYTIVLVGHSLGAGTASILAIMLRNRYPDLTCYAYSPPGGLLSLEAAEYSRTFITSVVLGKDVVPRLGLHQMESLRFDLINAIQTCSLSKWRLIGGTICCCCCCSTTLEHDERLFGQRSDSIVATADSTSIAACSTGANSTTAPASITDHNEKELSSHPNDASIALTVHQPLYPPGQIIHIVRNHIASLSR
jgi:sn1-specific diacylglycerol lipase